MWNKQRNRNNRTYKILATPAHYILQDSKGSESYVAYKLLEKLWSLYRIDFYPIVGYNLAKNVPYPLYPLYKGTPRFGNIAKVKFYYDCYRKSLEILKSTDVDLIHHILPWGYELTFNLLALLGHTKEIPFVVGPLQSPQIFRGSDEESFERYSKIKTPNLLLLLRRYNQEFFRPILKELSIKTLRKTDMVIVVNENAKKLFSKYIEKEKIRVIPFGVDVNKFKYCFTRRKKLEIMFAGVLVERKGIKYLLQAFEKVLKDISTVKLRVFGDGPQKNNLKKLSKKLGIANNVIFEGFVTREELIKRYENADIFVFPSLSEADPMVLKEAMAAGIPSIASNIPGPNEIIEDGKTGYLFPKKDISALANCILKLLDDDVLRQKMSKEARKVSEKKYNWTIIAGQFFDVYRNVIENKK